MAHAIAKLMLEHAETFLERSEAVKTALYLGMPFQEIEEYLDWLDAVRSAKPGHAPHPNSASELSEKRVNVAEPSSPILPAHCQRNIPKPAGG
jgi:hypothetical protein